MISKLFSAVALALATSWSPQALAQTHVQVPGHVAAAVADVARPPVDTARDAGRKPAEMLAFAGVKPGDKILELIPGKGYFTRVLAKAVGPTGKVYAAEAPPYPDETGKVPSGPRPIALLARQPGYSNISPFDLDPTKPIRSPEPVDVVWIAQNYHDFHLAELKLDVAAANRQLFDALKPGGTLIVIDHAAVAGAPLSVADTLHRIDPAKARAELEAAGFRFEGETDVLRNPADPRTASVFDPSVRGKTDQFVYKFQKPS